MELNSPEDTKKLSKKLSKIITNGDTIFLYGEIGVGKTTFTRYLINEFETKNGIKKSDILSPTFNIVYDYKIGKTKISHFDLYRLTSYRDIKELGMFEISENHIKIVEWPELIETKPKDRIDIQFEYTKSMSSRKVNIKGFGKWKEYQFNEI